MSTHISAKKGEIAKIVFLAGDPLRAKFMAKKYLSNVKEVSSVRNENYYTGEYKGHKVTFGSSGMGQFSISTYAHELYNDYDVDGYYSYRFNRGLYQRFRCYESRYY